MLNSNTDSQVFGPPERRVAPAGNHMGKMLGFVDLFAHVKSRVPIVLLLLQFELYHAVMLFGNPSIELTTRFPLTKNKEME